MKSRLVSHIVRLYDGSISYLANPKSNWYMASAHAAKTHILSHQYQYYVDDKLAGRVLIQLGTNPNGTTVFSAPSPVGQDLLDDLPTRSLFGEGHIAKTV